MKTDKEFEEAFYKGAHQAMQETRLEIALELIKKVYAEEPALTHLHEASVYVVTSLRRLRDKK